MNSHRNVKNGSEFTGLLCLILLGALGLSHLWSCGALDSDQDPVILVVGAQKLTQKTLEHDLAFAIEELPISARDREQIRAELLEQIIDRYLILEYANRQNIGVSEKEFSTHLKNIKEGYTESLFEQVLLRKSVDPETWIRKFKEQLIIEKVIHSVASNVLLPDHTEMKAYFESDPNHFKTPEQVKFRQIFCQTRKDADGLYKRIRAGEDFGELARKHSSGPEAENGSEVGWVAEGILEKPLDEMLFKMIPGDVSPVTKGTLGYHILEVLDRRPGGFQDFSRIITDIEKELFQKKQKAFCRKWLQSLRTKINVRINQRAIEELEIS